MIKRLWMQRLLQVAPPNSYLKLSSDKKKHAWIHGVYEHY